MAEAAMDTSVKIRASVPSGLEMTAAEECTAIMGKRPTTTRGCIEFTIPSFEYLHKVDCLRSIENFNVVVTEIKDFCQDKSSVLERLETLPNNGRGGSEWLNALRALKYYNTNVIKKNVIKPIVSGKKTSQSCSADNTILTEEDEILIIKDSTMISSDTMTTPLNTLEPMVVASTDDDKPQYSLEPVQDIEPSLEPVQDIEPPLEPVQDTEPPLEPVQDIEPSLEPVQDCKSSLEPEILSAIAAEFKGCSFRVTANRSGPKTLYCSTDAAKYLGSGIISSFNWSVDLKTSDIEIILNLNNDGIVVGVALTRESKHRRNLTYLGPTSLRPTIAYGLLRLAHPKPGDIILDPMCGGGSIGIEGFHGFPNTFHLSGDIHNLACKRARDNIVAITNKMGVASSKTVGVPMDIIKWDICNLPLKTSSVDVIVTDMPFGKRMGSKANNWILYRRSLEECGRICVPETGRGIFLTHDTKAIAAAMKVLSSLWQRYRTYWINHGGLKTGVYILLRTKARL